MPIVAMLLVVVLLGAFLWLLHRNEAEDERLELIKNVLWVEQNLRFQLTSDEDKLRNLADTMGHVDDDTAKLVPAMRQVMTSNPALRQLLWLDADGGSRMALPPAVGLPEDADKPPTENAIRAQAFRAARSLGRRAYSAPYPLGDGDTGFDLMMPVYSGDRFEGVLVGVFSLAAILNHHVPWWFTERYQLEVLDVTGAVLESKSRLATPKGQLSHAIPFDPPGHGMSLVATVHVKRSDTARNILVIAIFALTASALWSLWALRRHIRRRVDAENALRAEYAFRKAMEDSLTVGMRARDLQGRVTYVNPAFCRMMGWSAEEMIGHGPEMPYWVPEDMEKTRAAFNAVMTGQAPPDGFELRFRRANGDRFDALIYEAPLIDADGHHTGWMGSILDVTERKRAEEMARQQQEKLQQTARLITMGEMASTLAHELNQPLSAIAGYSIGCLNRIRSSGASVTDIEPALEKLATQAKRAGGIIKHIHDFVRKREPDMAALDLAEVLADSVTLFRADAAKLGVNIVTETGTDRALIQADNVLMQQVLLNLMRNGCEAMAATPPDERVLTVTVSVDGGTATTRVADNGCGVSPETAERLFAPFHTTKREGMGMGLSICRSIIEHHGGRLWHEPDGGRSDGTGGGTGGAVFVFTLPVFRDEPTSGAADSDAVMS